MKRSYFQIILSLLVLTVLLSCGSGNKSEPVPQNSLKKTRSMVALDRALVGKGVSYKSGEVDADELQRSMKARRDHAWSIFKKITHPVKTRKLNQKIPLFQTWYDTQEFKRLFETLFNELSEEEKKNLTPFSKKRIKRVLDKAAKDPTFGKWDSAKLSQRFLQLNQLHHPGGAVGGTGRTLFSPEFILHYFENYGRVAGCDAKFLKDFPADRVPDDPQNFAPCFNEEFPENAVMLKTVWVRNNRELSVYQSDASTVLNAIQEDMWEPTHWIKANTLNENQIFSVDTTDNQVFKLAAIHIVTKETREWVWTTFWWSDSPDLDFGADRPFFSKHHDSVWKNYKMCTVVHFEEGDKRPEKFYTQRAPTLAAALHSIREELGTSTWCANPYLEGSFPRSNCIGCHQTAPLFSSTGFEGLEQTRKNFPADFTWSFLQFQLWIKKTIQPK